MEIVLATRNKKKVEEMRRILRMEEMTLLTLDSFPSCPEVEEDADSFEGNARKKALAVAECTGRAAVADDSGLEVYALGGAPGVLSARYAGEKAGDEANREKLLSALEGVPQGERGARFVCCIVLAFPGGETASFFGTVEGTVGREGKGRKGFGYDPLFSPAGDLRTFAEMEPEEKDALSHRKRALEKLGAYFRAVASE
ncbi:MAG: RdgB/HAM1 family non-canonical purine NTP pyrophosphatase [Thermodesulfovibrionales bacterium]